MNGMVCYFIGQTKIGICVVEAALYILKLCYCYLSCVDEWSLSGTKWGLCCTELYC